MMNRTALIASLLLVMSASFANAAVTYTVVATASGGDLNNMSVGDTLTLDVSMRSDADVTGEALFGLGASVFGYNGALTYVSGITANAAFNSFNTGPGTGFGGLDNALGSAPAETPNEDNEIQWFNGLSIGGSSETGANDESPVDQTVGGPAAQLVFTVNASTTFDIGTSADFADAAVGAAGVDLDVTNAQVTVTVPEPGTIVSSMAALASVFAVVGLRRKS